MTFSESKQQQQTNDQEKKIEEDNLGLRTRTFLLITSPGAY